MNELSAVGQYEVHRFEIFTFEQYFLSFSECCCCHVSQPVDSIIISLVKSRQTTIELC